jgi:hypothetical protein
VQEAKRQLVRQLVELDESFKPPADYTVSGQADEAAALCARGCASVFAVGASCRQEPCCWC